MRPHRDLWFPLSVRKPGTRLRMFCFPFAGGGASGFRDWYAELPADVEVLGVQYPGHETRIAEQPLDAMEPLVESLCTAVAPLLDRPFVFFGHSLGALVAFELARRLRRESLPQPARLFVSARLAPDLLDSNERVGRVSDEELIAELRRLDHTDPAVFEYPELLEILFPAIRADFLICDTYRFAGEEPLSCPIAAFAARDDCTVAPAQIEAWRAHTSGAFAMHVLPGGHSFVKHERAALLSAISRELETLLPARSYR